MARISVLQLSDVCVTYLLDEAGYAMLPLAPGLSDSSVVEEERLLPLLTYTGSIALSGNSAELLKDDRVKALYLGGEL